MANLSQLESARTLALGDGRYYPAILPGVLPLIRVNAQTSTFDVQRWGAEFLAETFASPTWPSDAKETSSLTVLDILNEYLKVDDVGIVKSAIQAASTIYPLVYRHTVAQPHDDEPWKLILSIKSNILQRMDSAPPGVRICCVKFVQQVVLVQTPGMPVDPRRPEQNDISLTILPRDHPLMPYGNMEAEGSGLLDRLLDIIHGNHGEALLVTATLNALGMLIQRRPMIANRILSSVLSFNPLKLANSPMTPKNKVIIRSLERTTRALLLNVTRRNPDANLHARVNQYLDRIARMRTDVFDESNRKRPAPVEPTDGLDTAKRQRLGANVPNAAPVIPPLPPGPVSYRQLYTLHSDVNTANFDVQAFQDRESLYRILVPILHSVDEKKLGQALNIVRTRYLAKSEEATRNNASAVNGVSVDDDEEEYEPDFEPEDAEQIVNRLDSAPPDDEPGPASNAPLAPYKLPEAPPLTEQEAQRYGDMTIRRVFGMLSAVDDTPMKSKGSKGGFNRLAATTYDQEAWITVLCRLATRAAAGLDDPDGNIKSEYEVSKKGSFVLSETIRDSLFNYIMYDWRRRIDIAINWLNEEWYNDQLQIQAARKKAQETVNGDAASLPDPKGNYRRCALRLLDGMMAYIESSDKVLVRFISEIPELDTEILQRMRKMAEDPERVSLSIMVLQFLYMFRPPVREITVDVLEDMWRTNDRAKPQAKKLLSKWRPQALESENEVKTEIMNGSYEVQPVS